VSISLQPVVGVRTPTDADRHKFLVQSIVAPHGEPPDGLDALWRRAKPEEVMETKLACSFIDRPPAVQSSVTYAVSGSSVHASDDHSNGFQSKRQDKKTSSDASSSLPTIVYPVFIILIAFAIYKLFVQ